MRNSNLAALLALVITAGVAIHAATGTARADTLPAGAGTTLFVSWLDHASPGFTSVAVHIVDPGPQPATGTISIPGGWSGSFSVGPAAATYVSVPQGVIGGPAVINSSVSVQASVRVRY